MSNDNNDNIYNDNIEYVVSSSIEKDMELANIHLKRHVTKQGQILNLDSSCEYCQIHFEEEKILNKK
jgi:hypothetical protein